MIAETIDHAAKYGSAAEAYDAARTFMLSEPGAVLDLTMTVRPEPIPGAFVLVVCTGGDKSGTRRALGYVGA